MFFNTDIGSVVEGAVGVSYVVEADLFESRGIFGAVLSALLLTQIALKALCRDICSFWKLVSLC